MFQLPTKSRLFIKLQPANSWGWDEILANKANYQLEILAWQNTKDAQKNNPHQMPKLFIPEFMQKVMNDTTINKDTQILEINDINLILNMPRY